MREIVKEGVNRSNHPIQNPLLFVTEPRTRGNMNNPSFFSNGQQCNVDTMHSVRTTLTAQHGVRKNFHVT
jgi:hypothetical protein